MFSNVFGLIGYLLCGLSYLVLTRDALSSVKTTIGMILVSSGYFLLLAHVIRAMIETPESETKKEEGEEEVEEFQETKGTQPTHRRDWLAFVGAACLAGFFVLIHIDPSFTFHVRDYDMYAALGYSTSLFTFVPLAIVNILLIMYYSQGSYTKIEETGVVSLMQLVGRGLLVLYYGLSIP